MDIMITPHTLCGSVRAVASKSHIHRLMLAAALSKGKTEISYSGLSEDIKAMSSALNALGARITIEENLICVQGIEEASKNPKIEAGESGTTLRFLLPVAAALCDGADFCGRGELPQRPLEELIKVMKEGGVLFSSETLPLCISGRLKSGVYELRADISSQYISGLMFALPLLSGDSEIRLATRLESAPYVSMTIMVLKLFGIEIAEKKNTFFIRGNQKYKSVGKVEAQGDWSNAAFWLTANALCGGVEVLGLANGSQGDSQIIKILEYLSSDGEKTVDASQIPDLVPIISVFAASRQNKTVITGARRLKIKESDRLKTTVSLLQGLGGRAQETENGLIVFPHPLSGGRVRESGDHRIVMSAAIASVMCSEPVIIEGAQAAAKSYPSFFDDFRKLGGKAYVMQHRE